MGVLGVFFGPVLIGHHRSQDRQQRTLDLAEEMAHQMTFGIELQLTLHEVTGIGEVGSRSIAHQFKATNDRLLSLLLGVPT